MYQLTIGNEATFLATLGDVLVALNGRRNMDPVPAALETISLMRDGQPMEVVCSKFNKFGVTQPGTAGDIYKAMFSEVEHAYMKPGGIALMPYQVTRQQWDALQAVSDAAECSSMCFTSEQRERLTSVERGGETVNLDLYSLRNHLFRQGLGYGHEGPDLDNKGYRDGGRHENHVGFALAAGKLVPDQVIADCIDRENTRKIRSTGISEWYFALLRFPVLRGAMTVEALRGLCSALHHVGVPLSEDNVGMLTNVMKGLPEAAPTYVQVEDHLYRAGVIKPKEVPVAAPLGTEQAYSDLALRLTEEVHAYRVKIRTKIYDEKRANGQMTLRDYDYDVACVKGENLNEMLACQNVTAKAVAERNLPALLKLLDQSDEQNPATKPALAKHVGLKLMGLKAAARRTAIFAFCGYGPDAQSEWESSSKAEQATYLVAGTSEVISGKEYVDRAIREGKTEVTSCPKGRSMHYYLKSPITGHASQLGVKDGTLAYAKFAVANTPSTAIAA